jgi:signal transduction histidine kinase
MKSQRQALADDTARTEAPDNRLLRGTLHKTSNSLCGIKGYASLIARRAEGDADEAAWAAKIIREVERMEAVFRAVGDLTRPTVDPGATCGLKVVLEQALAEAAVRHPGLVVRVRGESAAAPGMPAADLQMVLRELLANAAEGSDGVHGAGRVTVSVDTEPTGHTVLRLDDDGPGMIPAVAARASEPFVGTKDDQPGVGLTRVATLMEMHGMAWHLRSVAGEGTTVTLEVARGEERIPAEMSATGKAD